MACSHPASASSQRVPGLSSICCFAADHQLLHRELWLGAGSGADWWHRQRGFASSVAAMSVVSCCCRFRMGHYGCKAQKGSKHYTVLAHVWRLRNVSGEGEEVPKNLHGTHTWQHNKCVQFLGGSLRWSRVVDQLLLLQWAPHHRKNGISAARCVTSYTSLTAVCSTVRCLRVSKAGPRSPKPAPSWQQPSHLEVDRHHLGVEGLLHAVLAADVDAAKQRRGGKG